MINITIDLKESEKQIKDLITKIIFDNLFKGMKGAAESSKGAFGVLIEGAIKGSPEYAAMLPGGRYYSDLGVPDIKERLDRIISFLAKSVQYTLLRTKKAIIYEVGVSKEKIKQLAELSEGIFITEKGTALEWLRWLLLEGDRFIIIGFDTYIKPQYSRTGYKIMVQTKTRRGWRVPPEIAGTENNNFITRSFESVGPAIENFMIDNILNKATSNL